MVQQLNRASTDVWNLHGFFFVAFTLATAPPVIMYAFRQKGGQEGQSLSQGKQERSQEPHDRLRPNWPHLCHMTIPSWEEKGRRGKGVVSALSQCLPHTHIALYLKKKKVIELLK